MAQSNEKWSPDSPLLNTEEACDYLKIGRSSLYSLVKDGSIPAVHPVAGRTIYLKADLDEFILTRRSA
jgi:excisionase family DNA binding protein